MKVLITGSSGNVTSKIAERFSKESICIGLDLVPGKYTTHIGSINDEKLLDEIIQDVDIIIHSAAYHAPHINSVSEKEFERVNVEGTSILLNLALKYSIKKFIYTSTTSVYGCTSRKNEEAVWVIEDLEPNPEDIYDITKLQAEKLCQEASMSGLDAIVLRMSRCFPEPDHLQVFYRLYRGVSAEDVAEAHWLAATRKISGFEIFNISAKPPFKKADTKALYRQPWNIIEALYPGTIKIFSDMNWERLPSIDRVYSIDKAENLLGYKPRENFIDYLKNKVIN